MTQNSEPTSHDVLTEQLDQITTKMNRNLPTRTQSVLYSYAGREKAANLPRTLPKIVLLKLSQLHQSKAHLRKLRQRCAEIPHPTKRTRDIVTPHFSCRRWPLCREVRTSDICYVFNPEGRRLRLMSRSVCLANGYCVLESTHFFCHIS